MSRRVWASHIALLAFPLVGCSGRSGDGGPASAQYELSAPSSSSAMDAAEVARRKDSIRTYYNNRVASLHAVATTHTSRGTTIDWIVPEGPRESPPPPPPLCTQNCATSELQDEPEARGPSGTMPVVRFDVESYLASVKVPPKNPADVLGGSITNAEVVGPPFSDFSGYDHAGWQFPVTNYGAGAALNSWLTFPTPVSNGSSHSLVEVLVAGGSGSGLQTVEIGLTESVPLNSSVFPAFFVFYTTNNYASLGNNIGGYNANVTGWVQYASDFAPGTFVSISADGGPQYEVQVEVERNSTAYWVAVNGEWIGYYPTTLFATTGLKNSGNKVWFYGEVEGPFNAFHSPATGMGSGKFASTGFQHAAYIRDMHYYSNTSGQWTGVNTATGSMYQTDASCYSVSGIGTNYSCNPSCGYQTWWNWFYYGGPGLGGSCM